jgi:hypothetical protein
VWWSENIGPAKTVDRLFRIADQEETTLGPGKGAGEDFVLQRIGVLELIDQRRAVLCL